MKLFVFEWISACGMGRRTPPSLAGEGWAMLAALVEDFDRIRDVETLTLIGSACPGKVGSYCRPVVPGQERAAFQEMVGRADMVLVIAPEFDRLLADHSRDVLDAGKPLLGSSLAAIDLAADKLALAGHLGRHGIPTPATTLICEGRGAGAFPAICKPRHGAGSQATFLVPHEKELARHLAQARKEMPDAEFLLQPFVAGQPASVTLLVGPGQTLALQPATQCFSADGRFHYLGGELPLPESLARRAADLGQKAIRTVDGLRGFVGVDLVLGMEADGSRDWVIEINPRPTASYIGLRRLAEDNLADALLRIMRGEQVPPIRYGRRQVQFSTVRAGQESAPSL